MSTRSKTHTPSEHAAITEELEQLLNNAECLIEGKDVSLDHAQRMAGFIAEIRLLLGEWADQASKFAPARPIAEKVRIFKERFLRLEGLVKEVRNGLERKHREARMQADESKKRR